MAVGKRLAGALPLAGASVAAMALAGVAVFTVNHAGCSDGGRYVTTEDGVVELVGGCLDPDELPPAPAQPQPERRPAQPAANQVDPVTP